MATLNRKRIGAAVLPLFVLGGILALWENEGRFDYHEAAREAEVVSSAAEGAAADTIALTGALRADIAIAGRYIERFEGYLVVERSAEIYSWNERHEDNRSVWRENWYPSLDNNSRNRGLQQTLSSALLLPPRYELAGLVIKPARIHFVDDHVPVVVTGMPLSEAALAQSLDNRGRYLYRGAGSSESPQLGDERVGYEGIPLPATASYFGRVVDGSGVGEQFAISTSPVSGLIGNDGILHHLVKGNREEALQTIASHLQELKWMVRIGGTLVIVFGIYAFFSAFMSLLYRIPLLGNLVSTGVFLVSATLGLAISLFVILSSLFIHNPLVVALPVVLVVAGVVVLVRRSNGARRNVQMTLAQMPVTDRGSQGDPATPAHGIDDTFLNLARLALCEGGLDRREQKILQRWGAQSGMSRERMKALFERARREGGPLEPTHRDDMRRLVSMAMADGVLSAGELAHLHAFGRQVGMSDREVRALIVEVESGMPANA